MLEALIAGVEVMCRVGLAVPGALHARHFHPTVDHRRASPPRPRPRKLYGLTEDQLVHAFGICGSQAGRHHRVPGRRLVDEAAASGLGRARRGRRDARSRAPGFTGPETVLEGAHGLYAAFAGGHDAARLDGAAREPRPRRGSSRELTFKPYPCGSIAQPYMDCAARLRERTRARRTTIVAIRCRTAAGPVPRLWEPLAAKHAPPNGYAAKFSLPYLLATILVRGRAGLAEFTDDAVRDPDGARAWPAACATSSTPPSTIRASSSATWRSRWPTAACCASARTARAAAPTRR